MREKISAKKMIKEEFEEYYYERFVRPKEEREWEDKAYRQMEEMARKEIEIKSSFVQSYMKDNPQEICKRCYRSCTLLGEGFSRNFECRYVGLRIESLVQPTDDNQLFQMKKIQKGIWDEGFVPLSDSYIEKIVAIY